MEKASGVFRREKKRSGFQDPLLFTQKGKNAAGGAAGKISI